MDRNPLYPKRRLAHFSGLNFSPSTPSAIWPKCLDFSSVSAQTDFLSPSPSISPATPLPLRRGPPPSPPTQPRTPRRPSPPMGVVIERDEWALTPLAYPLLSAAALAAVLLPYFSARNATHATVGSCSPFDVGTAPFLRFRRAFLVLFSLASGE